MKYILNLTWLIIFSVLSNCSREEKATLHFDNSGEDTIVAVFYNRTKQVAIWNCNRFRIFYSSACNTVDDKFPRCTSRDDNSYYKTWCD